MALFSPFFPVSRHDPIWEVFEDHPLLNLQSSFFRNVGERQVNKSNVSETETEYRVEVEVPGYQKGEINIEYGNGGRSLIVSGRHESSFEQKPTEETTETATEETSAKGVTVEDAPEEGDATPATVDTPKADSTAVVETNANTTVGAPTPAAKVWVRERSVGSFSRTFSLPRGLDFNNASAGLENGVLTVVFPKAAKQQPKTITIS
jgi:HSP20 family molecular chaperone IbpA